MKALTYEPYKNKLAVRGDMKFESFIKSLGGRWNSRMKGGPGWTIELDKEDELVQLINSISKSEETPDNEIDNDSDEDEYNDNIASSSDNHKSVEPTNTIQHDFVPKMNTHEPRMSRRDDYEPRRDDYEPRRGEYEPRRDEYEPRRDEYEPRMSRRDDYEPRMSRRDDYEPRRGEYEPRRGEYEPRRNEYEPRRNEYEPRMDDVESRMSIRDESRVSRRVDPRGTRVNRDEMINNNRKNIEDRLRSQYEIDSRVDTYYKGFDVKTKLPKNSNFSKEESSDSDVSDEDYDSDEITKLQNSIETLSKHMKHIRKRSRRKKHSSRKERS